MENGTDYWSTGSFNESSNLFDHNANILDPSEMGGSSRQMLDGGWWYASKTWLAADGRRLIIGSIIEGNAGGPILQWSGVQSVPRSIAADPEHTGRIMSYPIIELQSLRVGPASTHPSTTLPPHSTQAAPGVSGAQLDVTVHFFQDWSSTDRSHEFGIGVLGGITNATIQISRVAGRTFPSGRSVDPTQRWASFRMGPHTCEFPLPPSPRPL
jgi:hypothetical protein